jgi:hypothetical protein
MNFIEDFYVRNRERRRLTKRGRKHKRRNFYDINRKEDTREENNFTEKKKRVKNRITFFI